MPISSKRNRRPRPRVKAATLRLRCRPVRPARRAPRGHRWPRRRRRQATATTIAPAMTSQRGRATRSRSRGVAGGPSRRRCQHHPRGDGGAAERGSERRGHAPHAARSDPRWWRSRPDERFVADEHRGARVADAEIVPRCSFDARSQQLRRSRRFAVPGRARCCQCQCGRPASARRRARSQVDIVDLRSALARRHNCRQRIVHRRDEPTNRCPACAIRLLSRPRVEDMPLHAIEPLVRHAREIAALDTARQRVARAGDCARCCAKARGASCIAWST